MLTGGVLAVIIAATVIDLAAVGIAFYDPLFNGIDGLAGDVAERRQVRLGQVFGCPGRFQSKVFHGQPSASSFLSFRCRSRSAAPRAMSMNSTPMFTRLVP